MHKLSLLPLLTLFALLLGQGQAFAQDIAEQPCDPQVYKQMSSRAWLESEREIMQNQNLIFKADSVLEYTCFDEFLSLTAWPGGDIFTHTTYFGPRIIPRNTANSLEIALETVVFSALDAYRGTNFNHSYLGGRGEFVGLPGAPGVPFIPPPTPQTYSCDIMAQVWQTAKCLNFVHNGTFLETDSFYPFKEIVGFDGGESIAGYEDIVDTRQYPADMACNSEKGVQTWANANLEAANFDNMMYLYQEPLGEIFLDVFKKTVPGECFGFGINTGVQVVLADGPAHDDGVCTNPGCTYTIDETCE